MTIPWIVVGPGVGAGLLLEKTVRIYDTAPTALAFLGLRMPEDVDGDVVHEIFAIEAGFAPRQTRPWYALAPAKRQRAGTATSKSVRYSSR